MKKFLLPLLFLSLVIVFSGCANNNQNNSNSSDEENYPIADSSSPEDRGDNKEKEEDQQEINEDKDGDDGDAEEETDKGEKDENQKEAENSLESLQENSRILNRPQNNLEIQYPEDWYFVVNYKEAQEKNYDLVIGFASSSAIWEMSMPYPIELVIADQDKELEGDYKETALNKEDKKYVLRTNNKNYSNIIKEMASSLKYIEEEDNQ